MSSRCWMCPVKKPKTSALSKETPRSRVGRSDSKTKSPTKMKKQNLFAIGFGTLLVVLTGCKSPERFTNLGPAGSSALGAGSGAKSLDLNTTPIVGATDGTEGVNGANLTSTDLADD